MVQPFDKDGSLAGHPDLGSLTQYPAPSTARMVESLKHAERRTPKRAHVWKKRRADTLRFRYAPP
jgi:hypothetical protein